MASDAKKVISTHEDLFIELNKDPEFVKEYKRQKPYYDSLIKAVKMNKLRERYGLSQIELKPFLDACEL